MEEARVRNEMRDKMMRSPWRVWTLMSVHAASRQRQVRHLKEQDLTFRPLQAVCTDGVTALRVERRPLSVLASLKIVYGAGK